MNKVILILKLGFHFIENFIMVYVVYNFYRDRFFIVTIVVVIFSTVINSTKYFHNIYGNVL